MRYYWNEVIIYGLVITIQLNLKSKTKINSDFKIKPSAKERKNRRKKNEILSYI